MPHRSGYRIPVQPSTALPYFWLHAPGTLILLAVVPLLFIILSDNLQVLDFSLNQFLDAHHRLSQGPGSSPGHLLLVLS